MESADEYRRLWLAWCRGLITEGEFWAATLWRAVQGGADAEVLAGLLERLAGA